MSSSERLEPEGGESMDEKRFFDKHGVTLLQVYDDSILTIIKHLLKSEHIDFGFTSVDDIKKLLGNINAELSEFKFRIECIDEAEQTEPSSNFNVYLIAENSSEDEDVKTYDRLLLSTEDTEDVAIVGGIHEFRNKILEYKAEHPEQIVGRKEDYSEAFMDFLHDDRDLLVALKEIPTLGENLVTKRNFNQVLFLVNTTILRYTGNKYRIHVAKEESGEDFIPELIRVDDEVDEVFSFPKTKTQEEALQVLVNELGRWKNFETGLDSDEDDKEPERLPSSAENLNSFFTGKYELGVRMRNAVNALIIKVKEGTQRSPSEWLLIFTNTFSIKSNDPSFNFDFEFSVAEEKGIYNIYLKDNKDPDANRILVASGANLRESLNNFVGALSEEGVIDEGIYFRFVAGLKKEEE